MKHLSPIIAIVCCLGVSSCSNTYQNEIDRVTLGPGQEKVYSFDTSAPMTLGILLSHDVSGGIVELQQIGSVDKGGTGHYWVSRQWQPTDGKIELKLVNNSETKVEVVLFEGNKPQEQHY